MNSFGESQGCSLLIASWVAAHCSQLAVVDSLFRVGAAPDLSPILMSTALIFGPNGGLLVLPSLANHLSRLTRIPDVLMLLALSVVIGRGLHLADHPEQRGLGHVHRWWQAHFSGGK